MFTGQSKRQEGQLYIGKARSPHVIWPFPFANASTPVLHPSMWFSLGWAMFLATLLFFRLLWKLINIWSQLVPISSKETWDSIKQRAINCDFADYGLHGCFFLDLFAADISLSSCDSLLAPFQLCPFISKEPFG